MFCGGGKVMFDSLISLGERRSDGVSDGDDKIVRIGLRG